MSSKWEADGLVNLRSENIDRYKRNFLRQAVCELRFPTLMELGEARPPARFVGALRKEYPHLELANEVTFTIGGSSTGTNNTHIFRSPKLDWSISLKQSTLSIETKAYTDYAQMKKRVLNLVEAASKIIDSEFFTRVGLRYINVIDSETDPREGWVNPDLITPICRGHFTGIQDYAGKLHLNASDGGCLFQHGIRLKEPNPNSSSQSQLPPEYVIDIDAFRNEIALGDTAAVLDALHSQAFNLFDWAIGPKAREHLSFNKSSVKG